MIRLTTVTRWGSMRRKLKSSAIVTRSLLRVRLKNGKRQAEPFARNTKNGRVTKLIAIFDRRLTLAIQEATAFGILRIPRITDLPGTRAPVALCITIPTIAKRRKDVIEIPSTGWLTS